MKKAIGIIILGLLWCNVGFAVSPEIEKGLKERGYYDGDPNQNIILESTKDYIVIKNLTAKATIKHPALDFILTAQIFQIEAHNHCEKNDFFKQSIYEMELDDHTVYFFCTTQVQTVIGEDGLNTSDKDLLSDTSLCLWSKMMDGVDDFYIKKNVKK